MPQRMRVTPTGRQRLYLTRHMWADEGKGEVWIEDQNVEAARQLGYVEDIGAEPAAPAPRRVGRRPKAAKPLGDMPRRELLELAKKEEIDLPKGYVPKDTLVELVESAGEKESDEEDDAGRF